MHQSCTASPATRPRLIMVVVGVFVVPMGLAARFLVGGWAGDASGGVLYAVMVYLLVAYFAPARRPAVIAVTALGICCAVELLQLTSIPRDLAEVFPPARLVLGTTFVAWDLLAYAGGSAVALVLDRLMLWGPTIARERTARNVARSTH